MLIACAGMLPMVNFQPYASRAYMAANGTMPLDVYQAGGPEGLAYNTSPQPGGYAYVGFALLTASC